MADSDDACVLYNEEGGIATLTLNRPKVNGLASNYQVPGIINNGCLLHAQVEPAAFVFIGTFTRLRERVRGIEVEKMSGRYNSSN